MTQKHMEILLRQPRTTAGILDVYAEMCRVATALM